jgi:hypothetical protein
MSHETRGNGTDEIAALLADRQQIQGWLDRLSRSSGSAPEGVRRRVRDDYEARLTEVVTRLGGFSAALSESLEGVRSRQAELEGQRGLVEEALAEAELRHAVGEFTDSQWDELAREHGGRIDSLSAEIGGLAEEAGRLADVLAQVAPPEPEPVGQDDAFAAGADQASGAGASAEDELDIEILDVADVEERTSGAHSIGAEEEELSGMEPVRQVPVEAPRFTPKPGAEPRPRERPVPRTLRFPAPPVPSETAAASPVDEMTFLKSVTLESGTAPRERGGEGRGVRGTRVGTTAAKTLKCTECGAMNRPTEWYCERCGAELAAV